MTTNSRALLFFDRSRTTDDLSNGVILDIKGLVKCPLPATGFLHDLAGRIHNVRIWIPEAVFDADSLGATDEMREIERRSEIGLSCLEQQWLPAVFSVNDRLQLSKRCAVWKFSGDTVSSLPHHRAAIQDFRMHTERVKKYFEEEIGLPYPGSGNVREVYNPNQELTGLTLAAEADSHGSSAVQCAIRIQERIAEGIYRSDVYVCSETDDSALPKVLYMPPLLSG